MKVRVVKCSQKGYWYENHIGDIYTVKVVASGDYMFSDFGEIDKEDAEVVEDVEKSCKTCNYCGSFDECLLTSECDDFSGWEISEQIKVKPLTEKQIDEQLAVIAGVGQDAPTVTNEQGGKQSAVMYAFDCLDPKAMFAMCKVLKEGRDKYGTDENWRKIPVNEHINHALIHFFAYMAGDRQDEHLSHALCRAMFALAVDDNE